MDNNMGILLDAFKHKIEYLMPSEIAETYRVLTSGKFKGGFKFKRSPYTREFVDTLSPLNTMRVIGMEKGSQVGITMAGLANILLAVMKQYQGDVLFMSDTDEQVRKAMTGFIDDMIRESGVGEIIGKKNSSGGYKKNSGDSTKEKKFGNSTLYPWSGQTVGKLSSISPKYSLNDECERYKFSDKSGGSPYSLIMNRHKTFDGEYKAYFNSTPELFNRSIIHPIFLQGDQRYYMLPCPQCGVKIDLKWHIQLDGKDVAGIYYKRSNIGAVDPKTVGYICQECGHFFKEAHKLAMFSETEYQIKNIGGTKWVDGNKYKLLNGDDPLCQWIPTATPLDPDYGSYHISALYSGAGFHTWTSIIKEWCLANPVNAKKNIDMLKTFYNQELGLPWEDRGREIKSDKLATHCRFYQVGTIPDKQSVIDGNGDIMLITCAVDLNGHMDNDDPSKDDVRLDYEVVAWCRSGSEDGVTSYSIDQGSIGNFERQREKRKREKAGLEREEKWTYRHGAKNNVWDEFTKTVLCKDWEKESGGSNRIQICGIDTGNYTTYANQYVNMHNVCVGLKGDKENEYTKISADIKYFKDGAAHGLYLVCGNVIKDLLANNMEESWDNKEGVTQPQGYMNFPAPSGGKYLYKTYFKEYEGEKREMKLDPIGTPLGMRWGKKFTTSAQHFFDCRVYNIAVQKIATQHICKKYRVEVSWENYCTLMNRKRKS